MSRPTSFTPMMGDKICGLISDGNSLRSVCRMPNMPSTATVMNWIGMGANGDERYKAFLEQYAKAMDARADTFAEEILEISDGDKVDVQRDKLRVDTRKWLMARMKPKKYGDRVTTELTTEDNKPLPLALTISFIKPS